MAKFEIWFERVPGVKEHRRHQKIKRHSKEWHDLRVFKSVGKGPTVTTCERRAWALCFYYLRHRGTSERVFIMKDGEHADTGVADGSTPINRHMVRGLQIGMEWSSQQKHGGGKPKAWAMHGIGHTTWQACVRKRDPRQMKRGEWVLGLVSAGLFPWLKPEPKR